MLLLCWYSTWSVNTLPAPPAALLRQVSQSLPEGEQNRCCNEELMPNQFLPTPCALYLLLLLRIDPLKSPFPVSAHITRRALLLVFHLPATLPGTGQPCCLARITLPAPLAQDGARPLTWREENKNSGNRGAGKASQLQLRGEDPCGTVDTRLLTSVA